MSASSEASPKSIGTSTLWMTIMASPSLNQDEHGACQRKGRVFAGNLADCQRRPPNDFLNCGRNSGVGHEGTRERSSGLRGDASGYGATLTVIVEHMPGCVMCMSSPISSVSLCGPGGS